MKSNKFQTLNIYLTTVHNASISLCYRTLLSTLAVFIKAHAALMNLLKYSAL